MKAIHFASLWLVACIAMAQSHYEKIDGVDIWVNTIGLEQRIPGQPVLVFESGLGTPMGNWDKVIEDSLNLGPIVTYDRPGIGESEAIDEIPSLKIVADRLVNLLNHLELEPPYVLIGHSLGGVYVRGFAVYYPEMLAGLVIIDPGDFTETQDNRREYYEMLDWTKEQINLQIQKEIDARTQRRSEAPLAIKREGELLEKLRHQNFESIQASPLPNVPVHILMGGRFDLPENRRSKAFDEALLFRSKTRHRMARWTDVIQSVDRGMLFYSGDAGHFVQWEDPELVIASINLVLKDYAEMKKKQ